MVALGNGGRSSLPRRLDVDRAGFRRATCAILTNRCTDQKISQPILAMASANEIPVRQVFEVDASRQSNRVSANVSGLFGTTRISSKRQLAQAMHAAGDPLGDGARDGHYVLQSLDQAHPLFWSLHPGGVRDRARGFRPRGAPMGQALGHARDRGSGAASVTRLDFLDLLFLITPLAQHGGASDGAERPMPSASIPRAKPMDSRRWRSAGRLSQAQSRPGGRIHFLRSPERTRRIRMAMDWKAANLPAGDAGSVEPPASR